MNGKWVLWLIVPLLLAGCGGEREPEFWIYTSVYKEVFPLFEPGLQQAFPGVRFRWYQSGSEKIAAKILAEQKGGGTKADLIMTSDLFFYQELKRMNLLVPLEGAELERVPSEYRDPDRAFAINRFPVMVLAYNTDSLSETQAPRRWQDLVDPKFAGKITMPSPLESGSTLTAILFLYQNFGEAYFEGLRQNDVLSAGGNGATLSRIQTGERPVGMVLMENILKVKDDGMTSVDFVVPEEGAFPIPSPVALVKGTDEVLGQRVLNWFLSENAQEIVVKGWVHSVFEDAPAPQGAPVWADLKLADWDMATFERWSGQRQHVKTRFQQIVLH